MTDTSTTVTTGIPLAKPANRPHTPTPVPLPTSQPLTESYDTKVFLQVSNH